MSDRFSAVLGAAALGLFAWAVHVAPAEIAGPTAPWLRWGALGASMLLAVGFLLASSAQLRAAAGWLALAVSAQAIGLLLIDAGTLVRYQHWRAAAEAPTGTDLWLFAALAAQGVMVAWGLAVYRANLLGWLREHLDPVRIFAAAVIFACIGVSPQKDLFVFGREIGIVALFKAVQLGNVILVVASVPSSTVARLGQRIDSLLSGLRPSSPARNAGADAAAAAVTGVRVDRHIVGAAVWVFGLCAFLALTVWERHPHIPDEVGYIYHARYLAAGRLSAPAPPVLEGFEVFQIACDDERCIGPMAPGWPAMLAVGMRLRAGWLVNPLLSATNVVLMFLLFGELYGGRTARIVVGLACVSPWVIFLGMTFMTHTAALTAALAAALCCTRMWQRQDVRWGAIGGVAIGVLSWIRPLDAVAIALTLGVAALAIGWKWAGSAGTGLRSLGAMLGPAFSLTLSTLITGALVLPYNLAVSGTVRPPVSAYLGELWGPGANALGFGANRGPNPVWGAIDGWVGHSPFESVVNAVLNVTALDVELLGWGIGSFLPIVLLFLLGRLELVDRWMVASIAAVVGIYSLYWFGGGPDFGARYWYSILPPVLALTARGLETLAARLEVRGAPGSGTGRVAAACLVFALIALVNFFPWRAADKHYRYFGMGPEVRDLLASGEFENGLVLVRGVDHPDYTSAAIYNPIDVRSGDPLFAHDVSVEVRRRLLEAYRDRPVWILDGPSRTGSGYRLAAGPLAADAVSLQATGQ